MSIQGKPLTKNVKIGQPLLSRADQHVDAATLHKAKKEANKLLERLASNLKSEIKKAGKAGADAWHYDASIGYKLRTQDYRFGLIGKLLDFTRYNAFDGFPLSSVSELEKSPGYLKLHEACKAADKALRIDRSGVTIYFKKRYSEGQTH